MLFIVWFADGERSFHVGGGHPATRPKPIHLGYVASIRSRAVWKLRPAFSLYIHPPYPKNLANVQK